MFYSALVPGNRGTSVLIDDKLFLHIYIRCKTESFTSYQSCPIVRTELCCLLFVIEPKGVRKVSDFLMYTRATPLQKNSFLNCNATLINHHISWNHWLRSFLSEVLVQLTLLLYTCIDVHTIRQLQINKSAT
jgi:hypothetical protein